MITMFLIEEPGRLLRETTKKRLGLGGVCVCMCVCVCVCVYVCMRGQVENGQIWVH